MRRTARDFTTGAPAAGPRRPRRRAGRRAGRRPRCVRDRRRLGAGDRGRTGAARRRPGRASPHDLARYEWVVVTSANGARAILAAAERVLDAARGAPLGGDRRRDPARVLDARGIEVELQPSRAQRDRLSPRSCRVGPGRPGPRRSGRPRRRRAAGRPSGARRRGRRRRRLPDARGARARPGALLRRAIDGRSDRRRSCSRAARPSAAWSRLPRPSRHRCHGSIPAVCIGPETADEARRGRVSRPRRGPDARTPRALAATTAAALCRPATGDPMTLDLEAPPVRSPTVGVPDVGSTVRPRRLRRTPALRALVRETRLHPSMLVAPLFVRPGSGHPGADRVDARAGPALARRRRRGGRPARRARRRRRHPVRPARGEGRRSARGRRPTTGSSRTRSGRIRALELPLVTIADTCLCEYTDHGHCGPLARGRQRRQRRRRSAGSPRPRSARRGPAPTSSRPSAMMDGQVAAIRAALDARRLRARPRSWPTRRSTPRPSTARSARRPTARPRSATGAATRWTRPTAARRCARWPSTSPRAPTSCSSSRPCPASTSSPPPGPASTCRSPPTRCRASTRCSPPPPSAAGSTGAGR